MIMKLRNEVLRRVSPLPAILRELAMKYLGKSVHRRKPSHKFSKEHPKLAVTAREKSDMVSLHKAGVPYAQLEDIFHLVDNNGMNSWRCVKEIEAVRGARNAARNAARALKAALAAIASRPSVAEIPILPISQDFSSVVGNMLITA